MAVNSLQTYHGFVIIQSQCYKKHRLFDLTSKTTIKYISANKTSNDHLLLEFSNTNEKVAPDLAARDNPQIKKVLSFECAPSIEIIPQPFYEQFQRNFIVSFDDDIDSMHQDLESNSCQQICHKSSITTNQLKAKATRCSIQLSTLHFGDSLSSIEQNQKQVKSQIITKKGCPGFQIRHCGAFNNMKNPQSVNANKPLPNSCRNNIKSNLLCFTSKATPQDAQLARKMLQKYDNNWKEQENLELFQINSRLKQFLPSKNPEIGIRGMNRFSSQREQMKDQRRTNIFQKLPSIR